MVDLLNKKCAPCESIGSPLGEEEVKKYMAEIGEGWNVKDKRISKKFKFNNFKESIGFINKIAVIAEEENHHPDIEIHYNRVIITLWTHAIGGLSENDFILGSKIDNLRS